MNQYIAEITSIAHQLVDVKKPIDDELLAAAMLNGLPTECGPMIMAFGSMNVELTNELVKGKLLQNDLRDVNVVDQSALMTRQKGRDRKPHTHNTANRASNVVCYHCKEPGHIKHDCPKLRRKGKFTAYGDKQNTTEKPKKCFVTTALGMGEFGAHEWYIDSCSSSHMSTQEHWLENAELTNNEIVVPNKQNVKSTKLRDVPVTLKGNAEYTIKNALHAPELSANLLSVRKMTEKGLVIVFDNNGCRAYDRDKCTIRG